MAATDVFLFFFYVVLSSVELKLQLGQLKELFDVGFIQKASFLDRKKYVTEL